MYSVEPFPSMKASALLRVLMRAPLQYRIERQRGSHRHLTSPDHPPLLFSFHDGVTVTPRLVRKILVQDVGLGADEALRLLRG
jgi:predicted RNA binding protein YcfA (HicA-like mRNA interferase family)